MIGRYRAHLETELLKQEQTFKLFLADKDRIIARLDEEVQHLRNKCERYELLLLPRLNPAQPKDKLRTRTVEMEGESSWLAYLRRYTKEQEELAKLEPKEGKTNGVHIEGRTTVHESSGNGESGPDDGHKQGSASEGGSV